MSKLLNSVLRPTFVVDDDLQKVKIQMSAVLI